MVPYLPAKQGPVQSAEVRPTPLPYRPGGHAEQMEAPASEYFPGGHTLTEEFVLPAGHVYPAVHCPLHAALASPDLDPNVPEGQGAVQAALVSPVVAP